MRARTAWQRRRGADRDAIRPIQLVHPTDQLREVERRRALLMKGPSPSGHASSLQPLTLAAFSRPTYELHGPMSAKKPGQSTLFPHS